MTQQKSFFAVSTSNSDVRSAGLFSDTSAGSATSTFKSGLVSASVSGTSVATISGGVVTSLVVLVEVVRKFSIGTVSVVVSVVVLVVVTAVVVVVAAVNDTKF